MKTLTTSLLILTLGALALTGCGERTGAITPPGDGVPAAPEVPPQAAFRFDFGVFDTDETRAFASGERDLWRDAAARSRFHWLNAAIRLLYLDAVLEKILTPPAEVLALALHQPPTYEGQGTWLWSFDWQDGEGVEIAIRLHGTVDTVAEIVTWRMVISSSEEEPPLADFLWFHGETSLVRDAGFFVFHERDDREVARLVWDLDGVERSLLFENVDRESEELGDFIRYAAGGDRVEVRVHAASEALDTIIEWSVRSGAGSISAPDYTDGERACWDAAQRDTPCEPGVS